MGIERTTVDLFNVRQLGEGFGITERYKDYTVVGQSGYRTEDSTFLTSAQSSSGYEDACQFSMITTFDPNLTGRIPKCLQEGKNIS